MTDAELLARLIYRAFVSGGPMEGDGDALITFPAALKLYARLAGEEALPELPTAESGDGEGGISPSAFAGKGSGEKREIFARLCTFVAERGLGARRSIADASRGALTYEEVLDMTNAKPMPLATWRAAAAAMDEIEKRRAE